MAVKTTNIILAGTTVIPVKLDKATETDADVKFNLVTPEGEPVKQVYLDEQTGQTFARNELERAWEGHLIEADAIKAIDAECKLDDLEVVPVPVSSIPWHYAKATYYIYPDPKASEAIKGIFHAFMEAASKEKVALLTKWTPRSRQSALAITFDGEKAVAVEVAFASDIRTPSPNAVEFVDEKPVKAVVDTARKTLAALADPDAYAAMKDEAIDKRRTLVEKVANGEAVPQTKTKRKAAASKDAVESVLAGLEEALATAGK